MTRKDAAQKLMEMADFQRRLKALATEANGPSPQWEADRQAEIDALEAGAIALFQLGEVFPDNSAMYDIAKQLCFQHGFSWTDPRTGITHHPDGDHT